ncbi:MAG: CaiB/BaiF CoA-transferase family protein [Bacteroidota bacterium]
MKQDLPPLFQDLLVIELASVLAGPSVGMFFAELGARVIKVENPEKGGDVTRSWKLPQENQTDTRSAYFSSINWGKESIALNLKKSADQKVLHQLLVKADILLTSFIPGQAERMGLGAEDLLQQYPRLILGEINGYGKENTRPAYDAIIQAEAGFMYLNGEGKQIYKMPVALMDVLAAHQLKEGLLLAFVERSITGRGKRVSASLLQSGISALVNQASNWLVAGKIPQAIGSAHPNIAPYGSKFPCQDGGWIVLAVGSDAQFAALCGLLEEPVPAHFQHNTGRLAERERLEVWLRDRIVLWKRDELLTQLEAHRVPAGAINQMPEVMQQPLAEDLQLRSGRFTGLRSIVSEHQRIELSPPPALGEHTERILGELSGDGWG